MGAGLSQTNVDTAGGTIRQLQKFVRLDGDPWAEVGSPVDPHPPDPPHTGSPVMVTGIKYIRLDGINPCQEGDFASCGHQATGRGWIRA